MTHKSIYHVTLIVAERLTEGARATELTIGHFSTRPRARSAIRTVLKDPSLFDVGSRVILGVRIVEIIVDVIDAWLQILPENYGKTCLLDAKGKEVCRTPGIFELWDHGTTRTPQRYNVGDIVTYLSRDRDGAQCLLAGVVTATPRRRGKDDLRKTHGSLFHDNVDITDEYLWYFLFPFPRQPYRDDLRCQTEILPNPIELTARRKRSLERERAALVRKE